MARPKFQMASIHWQITCDQTNETQDFERFEDCVEWAAKVRKTFSVWRSDPMTFSVRKITEKECKL